MVSDKIHIKSDNLKLKTLIKIGMQYQYFAQTYFISQVILKNIPLSLPVRWVNFFHAFAR